MSKLKSTLTVSDHFAGCGGSGQGAKAALDKVGGEITYAANHWQLAIDTYETNKLAKDTSCTDLSACDPRRYPSTTGSMFSPECTTHTPAGGNTHKQLKKQMDMFEKNIIDPATERSRATMWDVVRFAEYHNYQFMIVENVIEAKTRWPLFDDWLGCMHKLGYEHHCSYRNSMHHHPTPQSRDRMYIIFWKKGNKKPKLDYMPEVYCSKCAQSSLGVQSWKNPDKKFGKYRTQYVYRCYICNTEVEPYYYAAFNCIDWSDRGTKIGDRKLKQHFNRKGKLLTYKGESWLPLSPNTLTRIEYGREKYGNQILQVTNKNPGFTSPITNASGTILIIQGHSLFVPFVTLNEHTSSDPMVRSITDALQSQLTRQTMGLTMPPFIVNGKQNTGISFRVKGIDEPINSITTEHGFAIAMPWIIDGNYDNKVSRTDAVIDPLHTQTTINKTGLFHAFLVENKGMSKTRQVTDTISSITTKPYHGLLTTDAWLSFLSYYNGNGGNVYATNAAPTVTGNERLSVVNSKQPELEECYYRMLKARETKLAMGFHPDYNVLGSEKDQVKQCGNAVTPSAMEWYMDRCIESLN